MRFRYFFRYFKYFFVLFRVRFLKHKSDLHLFLKVYFEREQERAREKMHVNGGGAEKKGGRRERERGRRERETQVGSTLSKESHTGLLLMTVRS